MRVFEDRRAAGRELAAALLDRLGAVEQRVVVLAVPRGGLPVGAEVAGALDAEFDIAVVRKLRSPHNPELGFGAVGADEHVELDEGIIDRLGLSAEQVEREVADRREAVRRRLALYRSVAPRAELAEALVIVVDDGIATGGTARRACALARRGQAAKVVLAAPVAPPGVIDALSDVADVVVVPSTPAEFLAVGQAYQDFRQLDDDDTLAILREATRGR